MAVVPPTYGAVPDPDGFSPEDRRADPVPADAGTQKPSVETPLRPLPSISRLLDRQQQFGKQQPGDMSVQLPRNAPPEARGLVAIQDAIRLAVAQEGGRDAEALLDFVTNRLRGKENCSFLTIQGLHQLAGELRMSLSRHRENAPRRIALGAAAATYEVIIKYYPNDIRAHLLLGDSLVALDKCENAITHYRGALSLDPNHADALFGLYVSLTHVGKKEEGLTALRRAGHAFVANGDPDSARNCLSILHSNGHADIELRERLRQVDRRRGSKGGQSDGPSV